VKKGSVPLIIAWSSFAFFNVIAIVLFFWTGAALDSHSDAYAGLELVGVLVAWLGDLVAIVLACVGAWTGRERAGAILLGVLAIVIALGSAVVAPLAVFLRWFANAPVPIH
jgi:hypothetical protein